MRLGVFLGGPLFTGADVLPLLPAVARAAEDAGADMLALADHVVLGARTDAYPYGAFPVPGTWPYPEPLTVLAAVAAATERIELLTAALIVPLRPAVLLAKTCATVDVMSRGRLVLGAGAGWLEDEFDAVGTPFRKRGERMDDSLRACRCLWRDSPASFSSSTVRFENVHCEPRPPRPEGIPIWVGGTSIARTRRRIIDYATGWMPPPVLTAATIGTGVSELRSALEADGRNPDGLSVSSLLSVQGDDLERSLASIVPDLAQAGVTAVQVPAAPFVHATADAPAFFERLAAAFAPYR